MWANGSASGSREDKSPCAHRIRDDPKQFIPKNPPFQELSNHVWHLYANMSNIGDIFDCLLKNGQFGPTFRQIIFANSSWRPDSSHFSHAEPKVWHMVGFVWFLATSQDPSITQVSVIKLGFWFFWPNVHRQIGFLVLVFQLVVPHYHHVSPSFVKNW